MLDAISSDLQSQIDEFACKSMADRIAKLGELESGAYGFYATRVARQQLITPSEVKIRDLIVENEQQLTCIHDVGAGLGTLALAFACKGVDAYAIDRDRRRFEAMQQVHAQMKIAFPECAAKYHPVFASVPSIEVKAHQTKDTIAVLTNFVATIPEDVQILIIEELSTYHASYVDVQRFCKSRVAQEDYLPLIDTFLQHGFTSAEPVLNLGNNGMFYRFST